MPIDEDEHGTYIMNARDLCSIDLLDQLVEAGVDGFKIEGRTKSLYYLSVITRAYRHALDDILSGKSVQNKVAQEVLTIANRGYTTGFLEKDPGSLGQNYDHSGSENGTKIYCGIIKEIDRQKQKVLISVRNRFEQGDVLELMTPERDDQFKVEEIYSLDGEKLTIAHGGGQDVWIKIPFQPPEYALIRKRNNKVIEK